MFEIIFSSYLYTEKYNFNLLKFKKHILQTMKEDKKGRVISNYGGWQSDSFVKVNSFNEGIFKKINESVDKVQKQLPLKYNLKLQNYWYNVNKFGSSNKLHNHAEFTNTLVSGVFYITTPKNCGNIIFVDSNQLKTSLYESKVHKHNCFTSIRHTVPASENTCALFPAYLDHFVEPNLNKNKHRISISFNYGI